MNIDKAKNVVASLRKHNRKAKSDMALLTSAAEGALSTSYMLVVLGAIPLTRMPISLSGVCVGMSGIGVGLFFLITHYRKTASARDLLLKNNCWNVDELEAKCEPSPQP